MNPNLVVPPVGTRPYLNSLLKIIRSAKEVGAKRRQVFTIRVQVVVLAIDTFTRRCGVVETDDERCIVNKTRERRLFGPPQVLGATETKSFGSPCQW
jgi:lipopolysaccharide biosynthesis protein